MIPILHEATGTRLTTMGLGALGDAISCTVSQEINGPYTLSMKYPLTGPLAGELKPERIIWAVPEDGADPQPFQIASTRKTMAGMIQVEAQHISYRLNYAVAGEMGEQVSAEACMAVLNQEGSGFTFWTDVPEQTLADYLILKYDTPGQIKQRLQDIQEKYGGEYEWDKLSVKLHQKRGQDRGVQILYGKNLTTLQQDRNNENAYSAIYPYAVKKDGTLITLAEKTVSTGLSLGYNKVQSVDFSDVLAEFTESALRYAAQKKISRGEYNTPTVALTVSFAALGKTTEYREYANLERVNLGDTVHVAMENMGVNVAARVKTITFDVLKETCDTVSVGSELQTLPRTLAQLIKEVKKLGG